MRSTQGNEILIKPRVLTCESVPSVCLRDNNGSHKATWEGRTGKRAGIVIHSLVSRLLAPVVYFPTASLICCIYLLICIHPLQKDTCQRASAAPNLGPPFSKMQMASICGLLLSLVDEGIVGSLFFVFLRAAVGLRSSA